MSSNTTTTEHAREPEEALEAVLCEKLAAVCTLPVEGALTPATTGSVKSLTADSFVSVSVDQTSQDGDYRGRFVPHSYAARIIVHYALADDPSCSRFRAECRAVRAALTALTGDACSALTTDEFACDEFVVDSTSTSFEGGDNPTNAKTYTATLKGRTLNNTEA